MSIQEKIKSDNTAQEVAHKIVMEKKYAELERLDKMLAFSENKEFQDWMLIHVSKPYAEAVQTHLRENDTNKSFTGKGTIRTLNKQMMWVQELAETISALKTEILKMEADLADEDVPNNFKPEN